MTLVLPLPVTPSRTCSRRPVRTPSTSCSIACGWSPLGSNGASTRQEVDMAAPVYSMANGRSAAGQRGSQLVTALQADLDEVPERRGGQAVRRDLRGDLGGHLERTE